MARPLRSRGEEADVSGGPGGGKREGRKPLAGKTALVTGSARRLGRETALALAEEGADVIVHYPGSVGDAERTAEDVRQLGARSWTIAADLSDPAGSGSLVTRAAGLAGGIDLLVNNAAVFPADRLADVPVEDFASTLRVNALGPLILSRAFAGEAEGEAVVNLLDTRIAVDDPTHASYVASKRLLWALTRMLAIELAPRVRVNAVAPGLILPPPGRDAAWLRKAAPDDNPLGRAGTGRDVAEAVTFLLASEFITGQVVFVDGGRHLRGSERA